MREEVIFSVKLASGDFNSELRVPLPITKAEVDKVVMRWLDMMATAFRLGIEEANVKLGDDPAKEEGL